jgi:hypothetical protein
VELPSPTYLEDNINLLIPWYSQYVAQTKLEDGSGDTTRCCNTFLRNVLPYVVETVLQNGIFFIKDFPTHELTNLLLLLPDYAGWARLERTRIGTLEQQRVYDAADSLRENHAIAIGGLQEQVAKLKETVQKQGDDYRQVCTMYLESTRQLIDQQKTLVDRSCAHMVQHNHNFLALQQEQSQQQDLLQQVLAAQQRQPTRIPSPPASPSLTQRAATAQDFDWDTDSVEEMELVVPAATVAAAVPAAIPVRNAMLQLLPAPRAPVINARFPSSWQQLLNNWQDSRLGNLIKAPKKSWAQVVRNRFSKHLGGFQQMQRRERAINSNRTEAEKILLTGVAIILDTERTGRNISCSEHLQLLKDEDDNTRLRDRQQQHYNNNCNINENNSNRIVNVPVIHPPPNQPPPVNVRFLADPFAGDRTLAAIAETQRRRDEPIRRQMFADLERTHINNDAMRYLDDDYLAEVRRINNLTNIGN